ncbi:MAG TPA: MASE1 domain-containing protein [Candidatus Paceibacterota bacterium]|nr:MASE1 domain-containing protein [Candidatus Paceibacterota bacterium]
MNNDLSEPSIDSHPILLAVVFVAYFATAKIGLSIETTTSFVALFWPPSGIALAAYILYGFRMWPAIAAAAFAVNLSLGSPWLTSLIIAAGSAAAPAAGAYLLAWYKDYNAYHPWVPPLRDNTGIVIIAVLVPLVTATVGTAALIAASRILSSQVATIWTSWWLGDALGIVTFAPLIIKWFNKPLFERTMKQKIELAAVVVVTTVFAYVVFWKPSLAFPFYMFIPLAWAALRTGPRGVTLSIFSTVVIASIGTYYHHGPFAAYGLYYLDLFLISAAGIFLVFSTAVEERKNVLEALRQHTDELEQALVTISSEDEAKKEFLAVLAHEMRNPLATILSSIELINLQGFSAVNTQMLLDTINERATSMVRLLDDLLDISRVSQKKMTIRKEIVSVDRFITKLTPTVDQMMQKYGHNISIDKPDEDLFVDADPMRLEQIFINLLTNACKYTKAPGKIRIIVEKDGDHVVAHVRDNGAGIPANMQQRIFEPYFQINKNREGIGIGLPLTKQLVEMHGGTIEVRSRGLGKGSDFVVRLPLISDADQLESSQGALPGFAKSVPRLPRHVKRTFKVLIVDDNEAAADALARLLQLRGHTTDVVYTGKGAEKKALQFEPDVVVLDIGLPDIDGYEVAERLKKHDKQYYLIALTGYGQAEDIAKARAAGFHRHLTKPAGFKEVEGVLRRIPRSAKKWDTK